MGDGGYKIGDDRVDNGHEGGCSEYVGVHRWFCGVYIRSNVGGN